MPHSSPSPHDCSANSGPVYPMSRAVAGLICSGPSSPARPRAKQLVWLSTSATIRASSIGTPWRLAAAAIMSRLLADVDETSVDIVSVSKPSRTILLHTPWNMRLSPLPFPRRDCTEFWRMDECYNQYDGQRG